MPHVHLGIDPQEPGPTLLLTLLDLGDGHKSALTFLVQILSVAFLITYPSPLVRFETTPCEQSHAPELCAVLPRQQKR